MTEVRVVRVFTDNDEKYGNPLGVVLDTKGLDDDRRQAIAAALNFSETVFVEDVALARLRIFTPARELPLAGHPLVGTAWLLTQLTGREAGTLRPMLAGEVATWRDGDVTWIRARVDDAPPWRLTLLAAPSEIDALPFPPEPEQDATLYWAWQDEAAGIVRARFFAPSYGVPEDEATGSAALRLASDVGRPVVIHQGAGSVIYARPAEVAGSAEIGGRVVEDARRAI